MLLSDVGVFAQDSRLAAEDSRARAMQRTPKAGPPSEWREILRDTVAQGPAPVNLVGVGNQFRTDDAAGLEIASGLRSRLGAAPAPGLRVHRVPLMPERTLSRLSSKGGTILVFDAVEASKEPGEVVFCRMADTKYGFFATHNVPLRLVPGLVGREEVYLVGIQPESLDVGEGLTEIVRASVQEVIAVVTEGVKYRS